MTNPERDWFDAISSMGCVVCFRQGYPNTPGEIHHLLSGGRRRGHLDTICLCSPGHHRNGDGVKKISRHPWKARFEEAYGTEQELLDWTRKFLRRNHETSIDNVASVKATPGEVQGNLAEGRSAGANDRAADARL